jgi:tape measure domain-containing protein
LANGVELAVGYVSIVPETSKVGPGIERALAQSAPTIAKFGSVMGTELGKGISEGMQSGVFDDLVNNGRRAADRTGETMNESFKRHSKRAGRSSAIEFFQEFNTVSKASGALIGKAIAAPMKGAIATFKGVGRMAATAFRGAFTIGIGALGLGGGLGVGSMVTGGLERLMKLDTAKKQLGRISESRVASGESAIDIKEITKMLTNDGKGILDDTPISMDDAFQAVQMAIQGGIEPGKQLVDYMTALADAAGATEQPMSELSMVFNDIINKGKLQSDEIMQLQNRMINIPELLKRAFGWNQQELASMLEQGKVGINEVVVAIDKDMGGAAKNAGDTLRGQLDNMKTAMSRVGATFIEAISGKPGDPLGGAKDIVSFITGKFKDLNSWIQANRDEVRQYFQNAVEVAKDLLSTVGEVTEFLASHPDLVKNIAKAFAAATLVSAVASFASGIGSAYKTLKSILGILSGRALAQGLTDLGAAAGSAATPGVPAVAGKAAAGSAAKGGLLALAGPAVVGAAAVGTAVFIAKQVYDNWMESAGGISGPEALARAQAEAEDRRKEREAQARRGPDLGGLLGAPPQAEAPFKDWYPAAKRDLWGPDGLLAFLDTASLKARGVTEDVIGAFTAAKQVGAELNLLEDGTTVVISDNTPEVLEKIDTVNFKLQNLEDGKVKIVPLTAEGERIINRFIESQSEKKITPEVKPETTNATFAIEQWRKAMSEPISVTVKPTIDQMLLGGPAFAANGGVANPGGLLPRGGGTQVESPRDLGGLLGGMTASPGNVGTAGRGFANIDAMSARINAAINKQMQPLTKEYVKQKAAEFGLVVTSENRNTNDWHGAGRALDLSNGTGNTPEMEAFARYFANNYGGQLLELIYDSPTFSSTIKNGAPLTYDGNTRAQHRNHVHLAFGAGGDVSGPGSEKSDSIPAWLSNGEHVLTAKDVHAMGGQGAVYAFRDALHRADGGQILKLADFRSALHVGGGKDEFGTGEGGIYREPTDLPPIIPPKFGDDTPGLLPGDTWRPRGPDGSLDLRFPWWWFGDGLKPRSPERENRRDLKIWGFSEGGAPDAVSEKDLAEQMAQVNSDSTPTDPNLIAVDPNTLIHGSAQGAQPGPPDAAGQQNPNYGMDFVRSLGFIPASAGNTGVAGTSSLANFIGMGNEVVGGLIDTGTNLAQMAVSAAITGAAAAGSFGAGAAAAPAASAAAGYGIQLLGNTAKRLSSYGFQMAGIGADALMEQMSPFGMPRWLGYDYGNFMPQIGIQEAALSTVEKMGADAIAKAFPQPGAPTEAPTNTPITMPMSQPLGPPPGPDSGVNTETAGPAATPPPSAAPLPLPNVLGLFDEGGMLQPGGIGINMTNRPEPVLTPQQWDAITASSSAPTQGAPLVQNLYAQDMQDALRQLDKVKRRDMMQYSGRP